jgi:hypothetical protein
MRLKNLHRFLTFLPRRLLTPRVEQQRTTEYQRLTTERGDKPWPPLGGETVATSGAIQWPPTGSFS